MELSAKGLESILGAIREQTTEEEEEEEKGKKEEAVGSLKAT